MRLAFELIGGPQWRGGYNYQLNLFRLIGEGRVGEVTPVLFVGTDCPAAELEPFGQINGVEIVRDPFFDAARRTRRSAVAIAAGLDSGTARRFAAARIDVAFTAARLLGRRFPIPILAWVPDFQHRHLPSLFSRRAWLRRELGFHAQFAESRAVLLSSETARRDIAMFYPRVRTPIAVARFAISAPQALNVEADRAIADAHDLPDRYFFLPNQFWRHKNHEVVIRALGLLVSAFPDAVVATTGAPNDPRDPGRMSRLDALARACGSTSAFRLLGPLPYPEVAALLRASEALVNPSRFEGWSTTVEEGKAAGQSMLLSDIAVHREQADERETGPGRAALFFGPDAPSELAALFQQFLAAAPRVRPSLPDLTARAESRRSAFATAFAAALDTAVR